MSLPKYLTTVFCALFITIGAASGQEEKVYGEVGRSVSFGATSLNPPVSSIIWKQKSELVIKAIEWDEADGVNAPNPRFKDITTLDNTTGQITITTLKSEHSGIYTIDINSKEQGKRFMLEVLPPLPKPVIKIDRPDENSVFVYLICEYSETIIWYNSAGEKLDVKDHIPKGKFITVHKNGHPDDYYTCTIKNEVSEKTSDKVFRRDLFEEGGSPWIVPVVILILILVLIIVFVILYKVWETFHKIVHNNLKDTPCIVILNLLDGKNSEDIQSGEESTKMTNAQPDGEPTDAQPDGEPTDPKPLESGEQNENSPKK
ncbi:CD48 antigen-like isoform X1 [Carassius auratus]|uniref:CD48 antigen-like isoform X1 n=1 Tax=Carassius auratus TaxID=7957 RepID=A0A6P6JLG3_CARAU|nr:CD48 antigen-like isoform X1 [Carassius auratus]XP_026060548.1 CD48 antigen-like isoform X1 [Carassius auratus]